MIIMINGAFGVGKTSTANELLKVLPDSMIYDPEEVGFMLRTIIPEEIKHPHERTDNFQDLELWKVLVVDVAKRLKTTYNKKLIIPMTIYNKEYFEYIFNELKEIDERTFHFCLMAKEETIFERLRARGEIENNWCFQQTKKCLDGFKDECFQQFIPTDGITVEDVVKIIKEEAEGSLAHIDD